MKDSAQYIDRGSGRDIYRGSGGDIGRGSGGDIDRGSGDNSPLLRLRRAHTWHRRDTGAGRSKSRNVKK